MSRHELGSQPRREILTRAFARPREVDVLRVLLGRHQVHDPRSKAYPARRADQLPTENVVHARRGPIWDQGRIGSCTAHAALGTLMTAPLWHHGWSFTEPDCQNLYAAETKINAQFGLDGGAWPPNDPGSCFLAAATVLKTRGLIKGYSHAFGTDHALAALALAPLCIGIPWYDSMFYPNAGGLLSISPNANVVGGHELECSALYPRLGLVGGPNSWGPAWGDHGWWFMTIDTFDRLLGEGGDTGALQP